MFKLVNGGQIPTKGTKYSACVDLYANADVVIGAGETKIVPLGVKIDLEKLKAISDRDMENTFGMPIDRIISSVDGDEDEVYFENFMCSHKLDLHIRSSLSAKKGLIIANGTGQIDLDYPDEIGIILHNPYFYKLKAIEKAHEDCHTDDGGNFDFREKVDSILYGIEIKKGDRIAQITLVEHKLYLFGIESEEERVGGYGSTDKQAYSYDEKNVNAATSMKIIK